MMKDTDLIFEAYYRQIMESAAEARLSEDPSPENLRAYAETHLAVQDQPLYRDVASQSDTGEPPTDPNRAVKSRIQDYVNRVIGAHPDSRKEVWDILTNTPSSDKIHFILSPDEARWVMGDSNQLPDLADSRHRINRVEAQSRDIEQRMKQDDRAAAAAAPVQLPRPPGADPSTWGA
jgi:hypothetical protein